jgi:hypothetical protein
LRRNDELSQTKLSAVYYDPHSKRNNCTSDLFGTALNTAELTDTFWKNNGLVSKAKSTSQIEPCGYEDITTVDATKAIKFLYKYTASKGVIH